MSAAENFAPTFSQGSSFAGAAPADRARRSRWWICAGTTYEVKETKTSSPSNAPLTPPEPMPGRVMGPRDVPSKPKRSMRVEASCMYVVTISLLRIATSSRTSAPSAMISFHCARSTLSYSMP